MSLFWSKFPISETKKYNNKVKTCKYKHKIISPFSSRHLGWIPLLMWTKNSVLLPSLFPYFFQTPALNVVFRFVHFYFAYFFNNFPCFLQVQNVGHFPAPPHTHTPMASLARFPKHPQTIFFICFVFSNELDVKFNTHTPTHSYAKEKLRWTFPFWIFRLAIEKAAKKSKSVTKETYFFHDNRERRRRWSSSSAKRQEASAD